jgi:histidyl-tRNA synthetase
MLLTGRPRGTQDVLPGEAERLRRIEDAIRRLTRTYGYGEIRTPVFEHTELFTRAVGEVTDIVQKEMYTFVDRGGRSITLRAEGTAPVARAVLENALYAQTQPTKLYYLCPIFRYERPQAGRLRQHTQFGVEIFGAAGPEADVEVITLAVDLFAELGLGSAAAPAATVATPAAGVPAATTGGDARGEVVVYVNSMGCPSCRAAYREVLVAYLLPRAGELCADCRDRLDRNPMRVLDCKNPDCRPITGRAPGMLDHLCAPCAAHFARVRALLTSVGVAHAVDAGIVRGLDYYTRTVFEIRSPQLGAQNTVCGGGRYDGLVELLGGDPLPGVGFGMGIERLALLLEGQDGTTLSLAPAPAHTDVYLATMGQPAVDAALPILYRLRRAGFAAETDYLGRSLKSQMKYAGKIGARYVVIVGEEELARGGAILKDMATGGQTEVRLDQIEAALAGLDQVGRTPPPRG